MTNEELRKIFSKKEEKKETKQAKKPILAMLEGLAEELNMAILPVTTSDCIIYVSPMFSCYYSNERLSLMRIDDKKVVKAFELWFDEGVIYNVSERSYTSFYEDVINKVWKAKLA